MVSKRNGEIDLLRFVFALLVTFCHFDVIFHIGFFTNGYIGVEFFFLVSGYLMASHASRAHTDGMELGLVADETWHFLLKKVRTFYPYYLSVVLLQVVIRDILVNHYSITKIGHGILQSIPTFSLTFMALNESSVSLYVGNTWFLSAMLIAILLLYPLLLRHYKFSVKIVFPALTLFVLGYLFGTTNTIAYTRDWLGFAYFGVLRALAEMALGGSIFQLSIMMGMRRPHILYSEKVFTKVSITLFKLFCYGVVIAFAWGSIFGGKFEESFSLHALLFCSLGILLSFSNVGYCVADCKITRYLGKISLPIFIYHGFIRWTVWDYIGHSISAKLFAFLIVMSIIVSVLLMYLTDFFAARLKLAAKKL